MTKRPTQNKYLSIKNYLEYLRIKEEKWFFSDEMKQFLIDNDLPTPKDLSENNLRVYIDEDVAIHIYNMNEIKSVQANVHLS